MHATAWKKLENTVLSKRPDIKGHILSDSMYVKYPEEVNP